jgi:signal peptidase II
MTGAEASRRRQARAPWAWLLVPLGALALDILSKAWILRTLPLHETRVVLPGFFNLTMSYNPGAIFGTLGGMPPMIRNVIFTVAGIAALGYFGWEFLKPGVAPIQRLALGLILGGAMGNGLDRIRHGMVVDFLDFVFWGWHYWTFNLADSCIVCGAILLGLSFLLALGRQARRA